MKYVLAVHGFLGLPSDWTLLKKEFEKISPGWTFVPVDYMNIRGLTPDVPFDRWGENFNVWSEKNFPKSTKAIAGYSLGGRLALHAFESNPKAWSQAFFLSTSPGLVEENERKMRIEHDQKWAYRFQSVDFNTVVREWNAQPIFSGNEAPFKRRSEDHNSEMLAKALISWSLGKQRNFLKSEALNLSKVCWLVGQNDSKFVDVKKQVELSLPNCLAASLPGVSHRFPFEAPDLVARLMKKGLV